MVIMAGDIAPERVHMTTAAALEAGKTCKMWSASRLTFELHERAAKSKAIRRGGVWSEATIQ